MTDELKKTPEHQEPIKVHQYKPRAEVTLEQRLKASEIIKKLRTTISRPNRKIIAETIGIKQVYVSTIDRMHKDYAGRYFAPGEAVMRVIEFGGAR